MKAGDKVYRAHVVNGDVVVDEAEVLWVDSGFVRLNTRRDAWEHRLAVDHGECYLTRAAALEALREEQRERAEALRKALNEAGLLVATINAMLEDA